MPEETYRDKARRDVEETIAAHDLDPGGVWCAGHHEELQRYPCGTRLFMEEVAVRMRRQ